VDVTIWYQPVTVALCFSIMLMCFIYASVYNKYVYVYGVNYVKRYEYFVLRPMLNCELTQKNTEKKTVLGILFTQNCWNSVTFLEREMDYWTLMKRKMERKGFLFLRSTAVEDVRVTG